MARREHITTIDAAGENEHLQIVFAKEYPAFVLKVDAGIAKESAHGDQFLVVNLQYIAFGHRVAEDFLAIKALSQINVEDDHRVFVFWHSVNKSVDCLARHHIALRQRTKTQGLRLFGQCFE